MAALQARRPRALSTDNLAAVVEELADNPATWLDAVRFCAKNRWWARLHADDALDAWLITWAEDTGTDLHDHGDNAGAFVVISGSLTEARPARTGSLLTMTALPGGTTQVVEPGVIHDVINPSLTPAISFHAYSPPLREMTYYEPSRLRPIPVRTVTTIDGSPA
jgi:Cysteine dioxygenase type I